MNNKPKNQQNTGQITLKLAVLAALLGNLFSPTLAITASLSSLETFEPNISTTTANSTPPTAAPLISPVATVIEPTSPYAPSLISKPDRVVSGLITVYSSTPEQTDDTPFIGASGKRVYDGMIAVNGYPFGTKIKIPALYGDKIFTVDDRMNRRYGNTNFDIWMDAPLSELRKLGARRAQVEIYYKETKLAAK